MGNQSSTTNQHSFTDDQVEKLLEKYKKNEYMFHSLLTKGTGDEFLVICNNILFGNGFQNEPIFKCFCLSIQEMCGFLCKEYFQRESILKEYFEFLILEHKLDFLKLFDQSRLFTIVWKAYWTRKLLQKQMRSMPVQVEKAMDNHPQLLLQRENWFFLDVALEPDFPKRHWNLLYNSDIHGKSWTILKDKLPDAESSVLIVKDSNGYIFGGVNPMPWIVQPKYFGDSRSFLFSSFPKLRLYRPTKTNDNYVYFNHGAQTLPNGIAFGGQLDYFGFSISHDFEKGTSMAEPISTTFGNEQLSKSQYFKIDTVELWGFVDRDKESLAYKKSILDNPDTIALLEMSGRTMYSQNVRAPETENL